jgi:ornithine cyclodeaminase/alanine dehydrogenase-like protein (mu-crystallin family)
VRAGLLDPDTLIELGPLVRGEADVDRSRPRLFKSVGMAWEDLVLAAAVYQRTG